MKVGKYLEIWKIFGNFEKKMGKLKKKPWKFVEKIWGLHLEIGGKNWKFLENISTIGNKFGNLKKNLEI